METKCWTKGGGRRRAEGRRAEGGHDDDKKAFKWLAVAGASGSLPRMKNVPITKAADTLKESAAEK